MNDERIFILHPSSLIPHPSSLTRVSECHADAARRGHHLSLGIDVLRVRYRVSNGYRADDVAPQCDHLPGVADGDQVRSRLAEAGGQKAVECDRPAAALDVAEDGDADLELDLLRNVRRNLVRDASQAAGGLVEVTLFSADSLCPFGYHDDVELRSL